MGSIRRREGRPSQWEAVYRDPTGRQRTKAFRRKVDATAFLATAEADKVRGQWIDPSAGRVTLKAFAEAWLDRQVFDVATRVQVESRLRLHVLPTFGPLELRAIRPSTVQSWVKGRSEELAPGTVKVLLSRVAGVFAAAVEDGLIVSNPCSSRAVRAPRVERQPVVPWTAEQVAAVVAAHPAEYRAVPVVAAGGGLRQGEVFGLRVDDVAFLRHRLHVRKQVKLVGGGGPFLAPPKRGKLRDVPLADTVGEALAERLRISPSGADGMVFTSRQGGLVNRDRYNETIWKPALVAAGLEPTRANGMHACRHHYASVMLAGGVSIRALADYLGHDDPAFTLRVYSHLMPDSEDHARRAVDASLRAALAESVRNDEAGGA